MDAPENIVEWAEVIATYYRALLAQNLPPDLIINLVIGWQAHMLYLVEHSTDANRPEV